LSAGSPEPVGDHVDPAFVDLKTPVPPCMPAYSVVGLDGSMTSATTRSAGSPTPEAAQVAPPFVVRMTELDSVPA
jgi:hypothetical protein